MTNNNASTFEQYLGTRMRWHVASAESGGNLSLGEVVLRPGDEPPLHIHAREDETWYVLEGAILFQRGMERIVCGAGESILLPRGVPHGFAVQTASARILHLYTPAGVEKAFRALSSAGSEAPRAVAPADIEAEFQRYGVVFVGPPLPVLLAQEQVRGVA